MLTETEYTYDEHTYCIKQLPLGKSQDVLVRLMRLLGDGLDEASLAALPSKLKVDDINFLRTNLLGEHCTWQNDSGNWIPMGKPIVESHFAGRIGAMFNLLGVCLIANFSSFLADLRLDELAAQMTGAAE